MRQHWETFKTKFVSIKGNLQHYLNLLLHSVQALHFDVSRKAEESRLREEESKAICIKALRIAMLLTRP
jgi:hypothetical protein